MSEWDVVSETTGKAPTASAASRGEWDVVSEDKKFAYVPPKETGFLAKDPRYTYSDIFPVRNEADPADRKPASESGGVWPYIKEHAALPGFIREPLQGAVQWGEDLMGAGRPVGATPTDKELTTLASLVGSKPFGMSSVARGSGVPIARAAAPAINPAVAAAREAGYVLPPSMAAEKPGAVASATEALGGEAKTAQSASVKNQAVTNNIAARELGLPEGTRLTDETFEAVRAKANDAYKAVGRSRVPIKQDMQFVDDLLSLGKQSEELGKHFPGLAKNDLVKELQDELGTGETFSAEAGIQAVRRLRFKATSNLKSFDNPDKVELGMAQRRAADAVDDLMERNLADAGKPELASQYRAARQMIAKSHDVESATNTASGNVNAQTIARLSDKGRPLTGGLKLIADTAQTFQRAMQNPDRFGGAKRWSALDAIAALAATHGHPGLLAGIIGRPAAREIALSRLMQLRPINRPGPQPGAFMSIARPASLMSIMRPVQQPSQPMVPSYARP